MTDKQKREELIRIDHDYFGDFSDEDWDLWFGAAKEGFMEKFAVMLAERQAENQRLRDALGMQKSLWEMIKDDLNALDRQKLQVPFMDLQDPIGAINKALRPRGEKPCEK